MCGIAGKIHFDQSPLDSSLLEKMGKSLAHRGPDDSGIFNEKGVGLVHRRLSIIDLSPRGHQPMTTEDQNYWIVFNGEIYNFLPLRDELEKKGYTFHSDSDTEVILYLYHEYQEHCVEYLRGMFAFAIWDRKKQTLFAARDRLGKKPFKFFMNDHCFIFASELKAILQNPEVPREVDRKAIDDYLTYQYTPFPATGFKHIQKLPPAHYLIYHNGKITTHRYWNIDFSEKWLLSEQEWTERILSGLEEATKIRMIADVPLGAFLSGGVDSSAVVAMMSKHSTRPVKTFSIGFKEKKYDESSYARLVARHFQTDHTEFIVEPDAISILPHLIYMYEEPYADSSALPTYIVAKLSRQHVTVALNGDGGDEAFGGYPWYPLHRLAAHYHKLPSLFRKISAQSLSRLLYLYPHLFAQQVAGALASSNKDLAHQYITFWSYFYPKHKRDIYTETFRNDLQKHSSEKWAEEIYRQCTSSDPLDAAQYTDIHTFLAGALLPKVDIADMAVSLEGRSPFLDHQFMELAAHIPSEMKLRDFSNGKAILKKALENIVPKEVMYRKKSGFRIPLEKWFKEDLRTVAKNVLLDQRSIDRGYFQRQALEKMLSDHATSSIGHGRRLWALLCLELWHRSYIDESSPKKISLT